MTETQQSCLSKSSGVTSRVRVQNRHVIYVQGYDPRGLAQYYRMFRTELRKFGRLYQVTTTISRPHSRSGDEITSWSIETRADADGQGWQTRTSYDFLRFEDFIQNDLAAPIWRIVLQAVWIYWRLVVRGAIARFWCANWRFATFITWPHIILLLEAIACAAIGFVFSKGLSAIGTPAPLGSIAGVAIFLALLRAALRTFENQTYVLYLLCDTIWTWQFAHRQRPEWDERIDRFAHYLTEVATHSDADEIVIVGHSSGSFLAAEILARALKLDPALGRRGPRLMLLTLGGNFPIVGFHQAASDFRAHLAELAVEPSVDWIDCQARKDVMNFFQFDPIAAHGIEVAARRNPTIVPVRFREIIRPEHYGVFRWQFFRVHFQFVMANERPHAYDFFMIVCGPVPLRERMAHPAAALAVATPTDPATQETAWAVLQSPVFPGDATASNFSSLREPTARRRG
jgi:pimeloyl-ACP methyl ester carboxylesterase